MYFSRFGILLKAFLILDHKTGKSKGEYLNQELYHQVKNDFFNFSLLGFGFVEYSKIAEAKRVIQVKEHKIFGQVISCTEFKDHAQQRAERKALQEREDQLVPKKLSKKSRNRKNRRARKQRQKETSYEDHYYVHESMINHRSHIHRPLRKSTHENYDLSYPHQYPRHPHESHHWEGIHQAPGKPEISKHSSHKEIRNRQRHSPHSYKMRERFHRVSQHKNDFRREQY
jgi:RNA recognition motif-containing protein